jgi:DNA ligase-associated metallophosphoesterase
MAGFAFCSAMTRVDLLTADQPLPLPSDGGLTFTLGGVTAVARPTGALWVPAARLLAVADLHLGKAARMARRGGALLPPFETADTLARLRGEVEGLAPATVVCVGDSFDDAEAVASLSDGERGLIEAMAMGRTWVWIGGNHDPVPNGLGGVACAEWQGGGLTFRHIADEGAAPGEVSGHWHPKATIVLRGRRVSRRCFLHDRARVILPAFGTYTGGLDAAHKTFDRLLSPTAHALLLGQRVTAAPRAALVPR